MRIVEYGSFIRITVRSISSTEKNEAHCGCTKYRNTAAQPRAVIPTAYMTASTWKVAEMIDSATAEDAVMTKRRIMFAG